MTNDSLTVALMRQVGVTAVATYDADLGRIAGLRVYQPEDIP
jgi:predicted nucleic acid-binding protein